jgi:Cytoskeletal-regulatory complex EF hand
MSSGGIQTVVRDGRRTSRPPIGNVMNTAALQGANIAFNAHSAQRGSQSSTPKKSDTMRVNPKIESSRPTHHHRTNSEADAEPVSEMPEAGLVMDRIKAFSASRNNTVRPSIQSRKSGNTLRPEPPQIQAAALAAIRSASRTPQSTPSSRSISPIKRATTGNSPSRRKAISPAPKPDFLSAARNPRPLHAPAPIRKVPVVAHSLANITNEEKARTNSERPQSRQPGLIKNPVTKETARHRPKAQEDTMNSSLDREPSISLVRKPLGSKLNKELKPIPPISKPKPATTIIEAKTSQPGPSKRSVPRLRDDAYTSAPQSPQSSTPRISDTSQSDTPTRRSSYAQSTFDEATIPGSFYNTISRQDTGTTEGTSGMTTESLANAIIASSLASSRAPSPYNPLPPLPPPRRSRSHSLLHPGDILKKDIRKTPSPPKGFRQTLRDPPKPDEEANKNANRRHLIKHHPHKHHEGDRRRWRQEVTEAARKRYEGVWAANKGLWVPPESMLYRMFPDLPRALVVSDLVVHLVVRDIWTRSRLPDHTLEQIWNLVDRKGIGMLAREEFVVGLWLIDETLRGHKIPVKVPDSVWDSVRHSPGIKLPQDF